MTPPLIETPLAPPVADLAGWVADHARCRALQWCYAEFTDGALWGRFDGGRLLTAAGYATSDGFESPFSTEWEAAIDRARRFTPSQAVRVPHVRLGTVRRVLAFGPREGPPVAVRLRGLRSGVVASEISRDGVGGSPGAVPWDVGVERRALLAGSVPLREPEQDFTLALEPTTGTRHALPVALDRGQRVAVGWRACASPFDPDDPDTHLGHPSWWMPLALELHG